MAEAPAGHPVDTSPKPAQARARTKSLRHAASAVFAVTAVVPLMIFVWTLHRLDALSELQSQVGLGLALAISLLGFHIFRGLVAQMSELIQALGRVVERGARSAPAAPPPTGTQARPIAPAALGPPTRSAAPGHQTASPAETQAAMTVPGLGAIKEVHDLGRAMAMLWKAEAVPFTGHRVVVSIMNAPRQVTGTLVEVTNEGLLLETEGAGRVAVSYQRVAGIDSTPADESL